MQTDSTILKPCPFCGFKIAPGQWTMTNGFKEVVCPCGARHRLDRWNTRHNPMLAVLDEALNSGSGTYKP